jgi:hypothetical protein
MLMIQLSMSGTWQTVLACSTTAQLATTVLNKQQRTLTTTALPELHPATAFTCFQLNSSIVAAVKALQGRWVVTDTSTNGTFVNGVKIGKSSSAVLKPGDRLGLSIIAPSSVPTQTPNFINTVE